MSAAASHSQGRKPGWMTIPGGPKEPSRTAFFDKLKELKAKKEKLFEEAKAIDAKLGNKGDNSAVAQERAKLQERIDALKKKRDSERSGKESTFEAVNKARQARREHEQKLRELTRELGAFDSPEMLEKAIDHVMGQLEHGGGSLKHEKKTMERLKKLERAKAMLQELEPMQEAVEEMEARERELNEEIREVTERMKQLGHEITEVLEQRKALAPDQSVREERDKLRAERTKISEAIRGVFEQIDATRAEFDKQTKEWDAWKEVAKQKYAEKLVAERAERERRAKERMQQRRNERMKAKIEKRRNPYATEITTCQILLRYLQDRRAMQKRDEEERQRRAKLAEFNPVAAAPSGLKLLKDDVDELCVGVGSKKNKKNKASKAKAQETAATTNNNATPSDLSRKLHHNEDKMRQFASIGVEAPSKLADFDSAIETIQKKQKEYESHIKTGEIEVSSDDEEGEEVTAEENTAGAAAADADKTADAAAE